MKECLLVTHISSDGDERPVIVVPLQPTTARINEAIADSFKDWACPPGEGEYVLVHNFPYVHIMRRADEADEFYEDECDGVFYLTNVAVDI